MTEYEGAMPQFHNALRSHAEALRMGAKETSKRKLPYALALSIDSHLTCKLYFKSAFFKNFTRNRGPGDFSNGAQVRARTFKEVELSEYIILNQTTKQPTF